MSNSRSRKFPNINPRGKLTIGAVIVAVLTFAYHALVDVPPRHNDRRTASQQQRSPQTSRPGGNAAAGQFDYLTLVLSWSPTFCEEQRNTSRDNPQCNGSRPYAFVLHGLWPQNNKGWPESCPTSFKPWVPNEVINSMLDIMPSRPLIIHEYKKHGTCSGLEAGDYFQMARRIYSGIKIPDNYIQLRQQIVTSTGAVEQDFLRANKQLNASMISISCTGGGSTPRLQEVRICFDKGGTPKTCGDNERQGKLCRSDRVTMPPVR